LHGFADASIRVAAGFRFELFLKLVYCFPGAGTKFLTFCFFGRQPVTQAAQDFLEQGNVLSLHFNGQRAFRTFHRNPPCLNGVKNNSTKSALF
jgi:hypothetical protein